MNTTPNDADKRRTNDPKANPDPITGEPGSHPVGTGTGAAAAGLAGAAVGTLAGPVGAVAGAVIGAVAGGLAGKGVGEAFNPTVEAAYWRDNHRHQPFAAAHGYDEYADAYRVGYEGSAKYAATHQSFEDAEAQLKADYEASRATIAWPEARPASQAAWSRVKRSTERAS